MAKLSMGEVYDLLSRALGEVDDAVSFMETLSEFEDEEATARREGKMELVEQLGHALKELTEEYKEKLEEGEDDDSYRICNECGSIMTSGYLIEGGLEYYCSDECLHKHVTPKEWLDLYGDGETDSYYTDWEINPPLKYRVKEEVA